MAGDAPGKQPAKSGWLELLVEYGPILAFFLTYHHFAPAKGASGYGEVFAVIRGTVAFMVAAVVALGVSMWRFKRVSPMLVLSTVLVLFFGTLTIFLQDAFWIQVKPTVIYLLFGGSLLVGWRRGKPLLQYLLQAAFEGLDHAGWMILSRNWGFFFLFFAALNEVLRRTLTTGEWITAKLWLFMPLSFLFTFAHMPMLLRHGLAGEAKEEAETNTPHE